MSRPVFRRRDFMKTATLGTASLALGGNALARAATRRRPNILYIMSDDHAANAISCYGSRLSRVARTPNIDRIAAEGVRLQECFCTNSICTPSRATILTGQYSHVNGVYTLADRLDPTRQNVAKLLQRAGYQTAIIGKWHLKTDPSGFDYWQVLPGQGRYHDPRFYEIHGDGKRFKAYKGFSTDLITDFSLDWLKQRNVEKPFFLMCHFKNCHAPWDYAQRHAELYRDVEIPEPASLWEDKSHRSPGSREYGFTIETNVERMSRKNYPTGPLDTSGMNSEQRRKAGYQKYLKDYLRCVAAIDENVGRLLEYLDKEGLTENTVVMYTSDQGLFLGEHDYIDKRWMFEEALQMPFLARYPGEIKPGSVNDDIIINADFAPTFLDFAGRPTPADMQGRSFRTNLAGKTPTDWRSAMYYRYWQHTTRPAHYGIRTKRYKLIFFYGLPLDAKGADKVPTQPGLELYDLEKDPKELKNVYNDPAYATVVKKLKAQLLHLKQELGDTDEKYPDLMKLRRAVWD